MIINNNCVINQNKLPQLFCKGIQGYYLVKKNVNTLNYGYGEESIDCPL